MDKCYPFLKWAGGKRWLLSHASELFAAPYNRYIEPFLGSGAVFFALAPSRALLADTNSELINTYSAIKSDWRKLLSLLRRHQRNHCREYYYEMRSAAPKDRWERAARFIYLNRTCWNGLYRVNRTGQFNVPIGTKTQIILPTDNFELLAARLRNATLHAGDFAWAICQAKRGDLIYADPPYTINHERNGFLKYNQKLFSWEDQKRLRNVLAVAIQKGVRVIVSNACHPSIHDLYGQGFEMRILRRYSRISGQNNGRRLGREYLITGEYKCT